MATYPAGPSGSVSAYQRLPDGGSPSHHGGRQHYFLGDAELDGDSDGEWPLESQRQPRKSFWQRMSPFGKREEDLRRSSALLTLIPLTDERLKPRHTKLLVGGLLLLAVALASGVFVLVPRGVTVGSIQVHSSRMSFNTSKSTYQIILTATIPIYNPNFLSVVVRGDLEVSFYDQRAGLTVMDPVTIRARAFPEVISVEMDASSVPQKYLFTIYTQCFTFPEKIIFFLTGKLKSEYLGQTLTIPTIDNYFIIGCTNGREEPPPSPAQPAPPPSPKRFRPPPPPAPHLDAFADAGATSSFGAGALGNGAASTEPAAGAASTAGGAGGAGSTVALGMEAGVSGGAAGTAVVEVRNRREEQPAALPADEWHAEVGGEVHAAVHPDEGVVAAGAAA